MPDPIIPYRMLADVTGDGKMDRKEFSIAMTLIKRKLQGYQLPSALPPSMMVEPMMSGGSQTLPVGMGMPAFSGMAPATGTLPNRAINNMSAGFSSTPASPARFAMLYLKSAPF